MEEASDQGASDVERRARWWLQRLASGQMSEADMEHFKRWRGGRPAHNAAFERERRAWRDLQPLQADLRRGIRHQRRRHDRLEHLAAGLAAAAALATVFWGSALLNRADYSTRVGQIERVTLPDGSIAVLDTDSAIAVRYQLGERRIELLHGQVWFNVRHDPAQPFRVQAGSASIEDIGTAFSVQEFRGQVQVAVTAGVVKMMAPRKLVLTAGEQVSYSDGGSPGSLSRFDPAVALGWRDGQVVIDDVPLAEALTELDRYYNGKILLLGRPHANARVSGVFVPGKIEAGVAGLAATQGLKVSRLTPYLLVLH